MSRPWIKLHASMLHHPGIGRLSDRAYRAWVTMLLMASQAETPGAVGTVQDVAWMLHLSDAEVAATLAELNGRVVRDGDNLTVRDWAEWQSRETDAERQQRHRDKVSPASRDSHVTVTPRAGEVEVEVEEEYSAPVGAWVDLETAIGAAYGGMPTRTASGKVRSWVGQILQAAGRHADSHPDAALALWQSWLATITDPKYMPGKDKAAERFGAWCVKVGSAGRADWDRPY